MLSETHFRDISGKTLTHGVKTKCLSNVTSRTESLLILVFEMNNEKFSTKNLSTSFVNNELAKQPLCVVLFAIQVESGFVHNVGHTNEACLCDNACDAHHK